MTSNQNGNVGAPHLQICQVLSLAGGVVALVLLLGYAVLGPNPDYGTVSERLLSPTLHHLFGTDQFGRDILARVVAGSKVTLSSALFAVTFSFGIGLPLGVLAGMCGGKIDAALMLLADILASIPELLLALSILALLGSGLYNVAIAVGISQIALFLRLTRNEVLLLKNKPFITTAYDIGGTFWRVFWRHYLPNGMPPSVSLVILKFSSAILSISTICFLGYGPPPPTAEWGLMIAEGRNYIATAWWLTAFPGLAIVCTVVALHALSTRISGK
ncbi:ABC transporter permease [Acetobacter sp.]|uniref:ABC transporter permease n=1 Tax=Acetobacter sp. TaxID=440 RepID=UPI00258342E7|nr:ABC transporter permease [Acetobacter sp.]MCC6105090.1 ABC transporter permease [Acetobacter sp.]